MQLFTCYSNQKAWFVYSSWPLVRCLFIKCLEDNQYCRCQLLPNELHETADWKDKKRRPASGTHVFKLRVINALPHMTLTVNDYPAEQTITVMIHLAYSPDVTLCDFWLFGFFKRQLESYLDGKSLKRVVTKTLENIPEVTNRKTSQTWIERMKLCSKYRGDYFGHLM